MSNWVCTLCGESLRDDEVIAGGYGHKVVVQTDNGWEEQVCGPCRKVENGERKQE